MTNLIHTDKELAMYLLQQHDTRAWGEFEGFSNAKAYKYYNVEIANTYLRGKDIRNLQLPVVVKAREDMEKAFERYIKKHRAFTYPVVVVQDWVSEGYWADCETVFMNAVEYYTKKLTEKREEVKELENILQGLMK